MDKKQILEKIKKCLALSKSANEHEAAAALEKARELMDEYNVTEADVLTADVNEARAKASAVERPASHELRLARTVSKAFRCECLFTSKWNIKTFKQEGNWKFIGLNIAPELAQFAFEVLLRQLKKERAAYIKTKLKRCKSTNKTIRADAFCDGWTAEVKNRVEEFANYKPIPEIKTYINTKYPALTSRSVESRAKGKNGRIGDSISNDFFNGAIAGQDVKLQHGVGGAERKELK